MVFIFHIWDVILPIDELHHLSRWSSHHKSARAVKFHMTGEINIHKLPINPNYFGVATVARPIYLYMSVQTIYGTIMELNGGFFSQEIWIARG